VDGLVGPHARGGDVEDYLGGAHGNEGDKLHMRSQRSIDLEDAMHSVVDVSM